jgi:hypothetical protein
VPLEIVNPHRVAPASLLRPRCRSPTAPTVVGLVNFPAPIRSQASIAALHPCSPKIRHCRMRAISSLATAAGQTKLSAAQPGA